LSALGLLSGGLDSSIAAGLLARLGLRVEAVHFKTGFGRPAYERSMEGRADHVIDIAEEFFAKVLMEPRFGYGSAMNPCIDCRIFMLRRAALLARGRGIDVLFTGEVVGQRTMGQSRAALRTIEREAGLEGRLLRPLCAAFMPPTAAEREGLVDRRALGSIHGAGRKRQFALARELGISGYPAPAAGCCRLADRAFAGRLRDQLAHGGGGFMPPEEIALLERGRHFRLSWNLKAILGRNLEESRWLADRAQERFGILIGEGDPSSRRAAASLAARYSARRGEAEVEVLLRRADEEELVRVRPAGEEELERWRL